MDTVNGDTWITQYARWIRSHEARLGGVGVDPKNQRKPASSSSSLWSLVGLASSSASPPLQLPINPHYLYYLLIRFEALGLPVGALDIPIPHSARPTSYFSFVSATSHADTISLSSRISTATATVSWWSEKPNPARDVKYLYSAFTKLPSVRIGPIPPTKLIHDFVDCPGQSAVPLNVFKNLHALELDNVDPRSLIGWDSTSLQLRSLTCTRSGLEDITDLIVNLVIDDAARRRGEPTQLLVRKYHHSSAAFDNTCQPEPEPEPEPEAEAEAGTEIQRPESPSVPAALPSLAWHSLRYLNLSHNSLTFVPSMPLKALPGLTHLDLSSNLLNLVPPALAHLPQLGSLNISDNLIDSVLGIYDTLLSIRVLNLARNRLESLCGLERLLTLERIDLRTNCIYEAGEVGRLATLASIREVHVKDNPMEDELVDWRIDCFVEFAREGRSVILDGEAPGWFEKQRIAERVPNSAHTLRTPTATEDEDEAVESRRNSVMVKSVKHHHTHRKQSQHDGGQDKDRDKRRNRRVVDLDLATATENTAGWSHAPPLPSQPAAAETSDPAPMSDSEAIMHAARNGQTSQAMSSTITASQLGPRPPTARASVGGGATQRPVSMLVGNGTWSRKSGVLATRLSTEDGDASSAQRGAEQGHIQKHEQQQQPRRRSEEQERNKGERPQSEATLGEGSRSEAFRRRIEALKGEVGDDWLRLLAKGSDETEVAAAIGGVTGTGTGTASATAATATATGQEPSGVTRAKKNAKGRKRHVQIE